MSPVADEEQAFEAIQSLADFHQGLWKGRANSFTVTPDVAAGVVQRKLSPEYSVAVKLTMSDKQQFSLSETISWDDNTKMTFRSLPVQDTDFDMDAVDASYSLDTTMVDNFPAMLSGTEKPCQFLIEHCIATGENRRSRCFALYGQDESLLRVVISNEEKISSDKGSTNGAGGMAKGNNNNAFKARDLLEMQDDVDRLVDKFVSNMNQGGTEAPSPTPSSSSSSSSSPIPNSGDGDDEKDLSSRLDRLGESVVSKEGTQNISPHDISLLELSSGVWLGDAIIRDIPGVAGSPMERGRGFGNAPISSNKDSWKLKVSRPFGSWDVGVQKIAWRWMWNFGEEIRQVVDVGKALGSPLDAVITKSLAGNVCVDESLSRRIPKEERMVYIDWSQHDTVGFLMGSCAVQVPRYINFDPSATSSSRSLNKPFITEFSVFQRTEGGTADGNDDSTSRVSDISEVDDDTTILPDLICSKISRLYNYEGKLKQGCSSFFTFKRFGPEDTD
jgi:hypothetical protein